MLLLLLACLPPPLSDTGTARELPSWSGTQIGEEGDDGCLLQRTAWDQEDVAPEGTVSPATLRGQLDSMEQGTLETIWAGSAPMSVEIQATGQAWLVEEQSTDEMDCALRWLEIDSTVSLQAGELLSVQAQGALRDPGFVVRIEAPLVAGQLGVQDYPEDTTYVELVLVSDGQGQGRLWWEIERTETQEIMDVGTWELDQ